MKKVFPLLCAATIATAPFAVYVQAEETTPANTTTTETATPTIELVEKLTLEDVLTRGLENSKNLTILQFNLEATKNQVLDTKSNVGKARWDAKDLDDQLDDLRDERKRLEDSAKIAVGSQMIAIDDALEALNDQIQALELAIKKLEAGQLQSELGLEESKEGVRLLLTSNYTNIVTSKHQIDFTKKALASATTSVKKAQRMYDVGMGSNEAVRLAKVAETNLQKQLEELEKKYNQDVATLSFDIGIAFNPNVVVEPIAFTPAAIETPENYTELIAKTYKVKRAESNVTTAIASRDDAYREYEEDDNVGTDVTKYTLQQNDFLVKSAEETLALTKDQVETTLDNLYYNADHSLFLYEEALRKAEDAKQDFRAVQVRFNLGLISKHDFDTAKLQLDQVNLNAEIAKMQNFLVKQTIVAAEAGYVQ